MKPTRLFNQQQTILVYYHNPDFGVSIKDVLEPSYWAHVATQLRPGFRIEVAAPDGSWWAMLIVRASGKHEAVLQPLSYVELDIPDQSLASDEPDCEVVWRGPTCKFSVVRKEDKTVLVDRMETKEAAMRWIAGRQKTMAA